MLLENMGFAVAIAEDGQEAVDKAVAESFDLILMDMQMPGDGTARTDARRPE